MPSHRQCVNVTCHKMKRLITISLFTLALVSCRKNKPLFDGQSCNGSCYVLTGKLSEMQSGSALPGTELKFYYKPPAYNVFEPITYLGNATTAADGSYMFTFDSKDFKSPPGYFLLEGSKDGYIYRNGGDEVNNDLLIFNLDSSKINIPQVNNLALYKAATLKFVVKATSITNFEFLTINYSYGTNGFGPVLNGNRIIDTTLIYKTASDIPTYINWDAVGNGVNIQKKDTLIVKAGTEGIYEINL